jgi:HEAT repeat protein
VAFALAIDEFAVQVEGSTPAQIEAAYQPYLAAIENLKDPNPAEAVMVLTAMPQPFFLKQLVAMANAPPPERWDRRDALNGLARLGTAPAWEAISNVLQGADSGTNPGNRDLREGGGASLRSYALLLLSEKADRASLSLLLELLRPVPSGPPPAGGTGLSETASGYGPPGGTGFRQAPEPLRGDILRALGFFHDPRAYQALFDNLHSARVTDRMNSILGLKNLGTKEVIPALLAALNDPEPQVRQVANFALQGLTGHKVAVSANPSREEANRIAGDWHAWWREHAGQFSLPPPVACHDW